MDGGKFKRKLYEVNTRAVSRRHNELVGKFKMAVGDMVSIRGQIGEYMYIPTGIKRDLVRSGVDCDWKGYHPPPSEYAYQFLCRNDTDVNKVERSEISVSIAAFSMCSREEVGEKFM